jgi:Ran GTPase-activating protein (RanGAP) involved in mRNA processing and transport
MKGFSGVQSGYYFVKYGIRCERNKATALVHFQLQPRISLINCSAVVAAATIFSPLLVAEMTDITLTATGPRIVVSEAAAEAMLASFEATLQAAGAGAKVTKLDISCRVWPPASLAVMIPFFKAHVVPTITSLDMCDVIASLETSIGLAVIESLVEVFVAAPHLLRIDADDNALGERGGERMRPLFSLPTLRQLSLNNNGMSEAVCQLLLDCFLPEGRTATALTHFRIDRNYLGPEGAKLIAQLIQVSPDLELFTYAGSRPERKGTAVLAKALAALALEGPLKLRHLDFNDCSFQTGEDEEDGIHALIPTLQQCPLMETLILRDAAFGPSGTARVLQAIISSGAKLIKFDLNAVALGEDGETEGIEALVAFIKAGACVKLEELDLGINELEDSGTMAIVQALGAANLQHLQILSLDCNQIEDAGAEALRDFKIPSLKKLILSDNDDMPEEIVEDIVKMYPKVKVLSDEGETARQGADDDEAVDDLAAQLQQAAL